MILFCLKENKINMPLSLHQFHAQLCEHFHNFQLRLRHSEDLDQTEQILITISFIRHVTALLNAFVGPERWCQCIFNIRDNEGSHVHD